jgi:hypothetical protein
MPIFSWLLACSNLESIQRDFENQNQQPASNCATKMCNEEFEMQKK